MATTKNTKKHGHSKGESGHEGTDDVETHIEKLSIAKTASVPASPKEFDIQQKKKLIQSQMKDLTKTLEQEAYRIIFDMFPAKIQDLDTMSKERKEFNLKPDEMYEAIPLPSESLVATSKEEYNRKLFRTEVPPNKAMVALIEIIQNELSEMSDALDTLSLWVKLNVPRIADGNNFGVEVQQEITEVLDASANSAQSVLDSFSLYHMSRAELVCKVLKYPGVQDFQRALKELDCKQYTKISSLAAELRNDYVTLYDLLGKNMETLTAPRGSSDENIIKMY